MAAAVFDTLADATSYPLTFMPSYPHAIQRYQVPVLHADDIHDIHSTCFDPFDVGHYDLVNQEMINPIPLQVSDHDQVFFGEPCCPTAATSVEKTSVSPTRCKRAKTSFAQNSITIGFRTRSQVDVLDDGYRWRKYGKKSVKNSPNPRNYYKCSNERCTVKKRVQRDLANDEYVITSYQGKHNHSLPGAVAVSLYASLPLAASNPDYPTPFFHWTSSATTAAVPRTADQTHQMRPPNF